MSEAAGLNEPFSMVPQNIAWDEVHPDGTKSAGLLRACEVTGRGHGLMSPARVAPYARVQHP
jgi:hypothetical protein